MSKRVRTGIVALFAIACSAGTAQAAPAPDRQGEASLQRAIDARLRDAPGARQVARNQIAFADGVRVTVGRSARGASLCGPQRFCVWADADFQGISASFPRCRGNRPKTYDLSKYGLPPRKDGWFFSGVTSWRNNMGRGYSAQFLDVWGLPLHRVNRGGGGHMPSDKNDEAAEVDMLCVP